MKFIGAFLWSFSEMDLKSCDAGWHSVIFLFIEGFPSQNCCCCTFVLSWRTEWGTLWNMCVGCKAVWYHLSSQGGVCRWRRDVQWDHARVGHQDPNWPRGGPERIRCWVGAMFSAYRHHPCRWAFNQGFKNSSSYSVVLVVMFSGWQIELSYYVTLISLKVWKE